ncbi:MAG: peptide deformylase [Eubacteriales bacterium]|jgi:peptide deformylase
MALRTIRVVGDPVLTKKCREVKTMTPHLRQLIDDMFETMYHANGVGLAAPQVGILKRIVVIDVTGQDPIAMINPVIVEKDGSQTGEEGCLSLPGKSGVVTRPEHVIVECLNRDMEKVRIEGTELLARCMCHEIDHLDGHMYTELVEGDLHDVQYEEEEQ